LPQAARAVPHASREGPRLPQHALAGRNDSHLRADEGGRLNRRARSLPEQGRPHDHAVSAVAEEEVIGLPFSARRLYPSARRQAYGESAVKLLTMLVRPFRAEAVLKVIGELEVNACLVQEAKGYSRQKNYLERYLGSEYSMAFLPKVEI